MTIHTEECTMSGGGMQPVCTCGAAERLLTECFRLRVERDAFSSITKELGLKLDDAIAQTERLATELENEKAAHKTTIRHFEAIVERLESHD